MRTVAVLTGSRADWGLLRPVINALGNRDDCTRWVIAPAKHQCITEVSEEYRTSVIERGDFAFAGRFCDWLILLGDRVEVLRAAVAASIARIRIAHVCGGDRALGIQDDSWRHAISKLAHIHFVTSKEAEKRLTRMGERNIHRFGSPGLDDMPDSDYAWERYGHPEIVLLWHPTGRDAKHEYEDAVRIGRACRDVGHTLWLAPNSDPGHEAILSAMKPPIADHIARAQFLGLLRRCKAFVGNSSAGVVETGFLGVRSLVVGDRQLGRARICPVTQVKKRLRELLAKPKPPPDYTHGDGHASERIAEALATCELPPLRKLNAY